MNRLTRYRRGTVDGNKTDLSATVFAQDWHDTQGALKLDKLGNWDMVRTDTTGGGSFTTEAKGHNLANEYTSRNGQSYYQHDDTGNLTDDGTLTFSYDYANHLVKAVRKNDSAVIAQYAYDALGRRVKKVVDDVSDTLDGTSLYYYDGLRVIERGKLDGQNAYKATHQHVWGLYLDEQLLYDHDADGDGDFEEIGGSDKRYYVVHDFLYSASAVMDPSGTVLERYDYEPYGKPTFWSGDYSDTRDETQVTNIFLFTGQMLDPETGLYHFKRRALHPSKGRFVQRDRLGYNDGMSLYQYVASAPGSFLDPRGDYIDIQAVRAHHGSSWFADKVLEALQDIIGECALLYWEKPTLANYGERRARQVAWVKKDNKWWPVLASRRVGPWWPRDLQDPGVVETWRLRAKDIDPSRPGCDCKDLWHELESAMGPGNDRLITITGRRGAVSYPSNALTDPGVRSLGYAHYIGIHPEAEEYAWEKFPPPGGSPYKEIYYNLETPFKVILWHELIGHPARVDAIGDAAIVHENSLRRCLFCRGEHIRQRWPHHSLIEEPPVGQRVEGTPPADAYENVGFW